MAFGFMQQQQSLLPSIAQMAQQSQAANQAAARVAAPQTPGSPSIPGAGAGSALNLPQTFTQVRNGLAKMGIGSTSQTPDANTASPNSAQTLNGVQMPPGVSIGGNAPVTAQGVSIPGATDASAGFGGAAGTFGDGGGGGSFLSGIASMFGG